MSKKVLIYSSFPPTRCGIGAYAAEQVLELKRRGYRVYTATHDSSSAGNFRVDLYKIPSILGAMGSLLFKRFDGVHIHYTGDFFFPFFAGTRRDFALHRAFQLLFFFFLGLKSGREGSVIFHEAYVGDGKNRAFRRLKGMGFGLFRSLVFHTEGERKRILDSYPTLLKPERALVEKHERHMRPKYLGTQLEARRELGLSPDEAIFLCIGFIQDHKGFHLAVEALKAAARQNAVLYIVGSLRVDNHDTRSYRQKLLDLMREVPNARLVEQFVDDVAFDRWISASDAVILPYTDISSSGVGARTLLFGRDLIINSGTNLGGQFAGYSNVHGYKETAGLAQVMRDFQRKPGAPGPKVDHLPDLDKPILFVMPMFGPTIKAGAEGFIFDLCRNLAKAGTAVEVWTTGSSSIEGRNNDLLDGHTDKDLPFKIRRFPTNRLSEPLFRIVHGTMNRGQSSSRFLGRLWTRTALSGRGMARALKREKDRFSTIHLCHYFGGSTHRLAGICPEKTFVHPFVHDEPQARHGVMRDLFASARGVLCNTEAERAIAVRNRAGLIPSLFAPIGNGIELLERADPTIKANRWRKKELLFIGRLIPDKNLFQLIKWVNGYNNRGTTERLRLNLVGTGPLQFHPDFMGNGDVHISGWRDEEFKAKLLTDSMALVQPSLLESFSLVLMESWALKTPVIVHADCLATESHVKRSGGGIAVRTQRQFNEAIDALWLDKDLSSAMGDAGFAYARDQFRWDRVIQKFHKARASIMSGGTAPPEASESGAYGGFEYVFSNAPVPKGPPATLKGKVSIFPRGRVSRRFYERMGVDFYTRFESRFRDPAEKKIFPSWPWYAELKSLVGPGDLWVDVGAGRGDFLEYLESQGLTRDRLYGVEPDGPSFVKMSQKGFQGTGLDAIRFFDAIPDGSIKVMSLLHIVEHIPFQQLAILLSLAAAKTRPGGRVIVETPNAMSIKTSASYFWGDPTHLRPVFPETLHFLLETAGFHKVERKQFAPHFDAAKMAELKAKIGADVVIDDLYGPQDTCFVAEKPS